jgi:hypothetical protein
MATIVPIVDEGIDKYLTVSWNNLLLGDTSQMVGFGKYEVKTVQISGVDGGAVPVLQGSMDGVNFDVLTYDGTNVIGAIGMWKLFEKPKFIAPGLSGGDGTTDLTFIVGLSRLV